MQDKKPYQDNELTLFTLAKQLKIHPNHLSQIINQHHNQNFFDYINEQRVIDVKEALLSHKYDNHSLLGIAHEFGFNSKASFNRAFKKFTGMTPSDFKRTARWYFSGAPAVSITDNQVGHFFSRFKAPIAPPQAEQKVGRSVGAVEFY